MDHFPTQELQNIEQGVLLEHWEWYIVGGIMETMVKWEVAFS